MIPKIHDLAPSVLTALILAVTPGLTSGQVATSYAGDIESTFGPVTDACAFEFSLWDATAGGSQIGPVIEATLRVHGGLYETELDFGSEAFEGGSRYLEVAVGCPADTAALTTLTRRAFYPASGTPSDRGDAEHAALQELPAPTKAALGTNFTYQGELQRSGAPVTGAGDFQFSLWDAASGGVQIGATVPANAVAVENGRFTTSLDFGASAFDGEARWLEIAVDYPSGTGSFTTLSPRQLLSAAPYALQTRGIFVDDAGEVGVGTTNPAAPLHVWTDGSRALRVRNAASSGGTAIVAEATAGTGWTAAVDAYTTSPSGAGIYSFNEAESGSAHGVQAETASPDGVAVSGRASNGGEYSAGIGVYGRSDGDYDAAGVYGETTNTGSTYGVRGVSAHGTGVRGQNDDTNNYGLLGSDDEGVYGRGYGNSAGVRGIAAGTGPAGHFVINDNTNAEAAVKAHTPNPTGYAGFFTGGKNYFEGAVGIGISSPTQPLDVMGNAKIRGELEADAFELNDPTAAGWIMTSDAQGNGSWQPAPDGAVWTTSGSDISYTTGYVGIGTTTPGYSLDVDGKVLIEEIDGVGSGWIRTVGDNGNANVQITYLDGYPNNGFVSAKNSGGFTLAGIYVDAAGDGIVTGDIKSFRVPFPERPESDIWYASLEGPEAAMYIRGTGRLVDGRAVIELPDHFRALALEKSMTVQLTPGSLDSKGLAVGSMTLDGIEVGELNGGTGNYDFHWVVTAARRAHQDFAVIRPWTSAAPGGNLDQAHRWEARLNSIERRAERIRRLEAVQGDD